MEDTPRFSAICTMVAGESTCMVSTSAPWSSRALAAASFLHLVRPSAESTTTRVSNFGFTERAPSWNAFTLPMA